MLADLIKQDFPQVKLLKGDEYPDLVIILGGDGSILEAVQKYQPLGAKFMGLNIIIACLRLRVFLELRGEICRTTFTR